MGYETIHPKARGSSSQCPVLEAEAEDEMLISRCMRRVSHQGFCAVHGDVSKPLRVFIATGNMTLKRRWRKVDKMPAAGGGE